MRFALALAAFGAHVVTALHAAVPPEDPRVAYVGRFDFPQPGLALFSWGGSTLSFALDGDEAMVLLAGAPVRYAIRINGRDAGVETVNAGSGGLRVTLTPADKRPATVEVVRLNQPLFGVSEFRGVETTGTLSPAPARPARRIEFIGDSITAGHGNEAPGPSHPLKLETENFQKTYANLTAQALGAEAVACAWSGIRLTKGQPADVTMPERWLRTLPDRKRPVWTFDQEPGVVVVNLGTNDFGQHAPTEEGWKSALHDFLSTIRGKYPSATIIFTNGPMLSGKSFELLKKWSDDVVSALRAGGDEKVSTIYFSPQKMADGIGGQWHPSLRTHALMARQLSAAIAELTGWTPTEVEVPPVSQATSG